MAAGPLTEPAEFTAHIVLPDPPSADRASARARRPGPRVA
jgi:hypothetical protein